MSFQEVLKDVSQYCNKICAYSVNQNVQGISASVNNIFKFFIQKNVDEVNKNFSKLLSQNMSEEIFYDVYQLFNIVYCFLTNDGRKPYSEYNREDVEMMTKHMSQNNKWTDLTNKITITMTTCKRYDLFTRTVTSAIKYIKDLKDYVHEWIVIDDNSSEQMREKMKEQYPFIRYIYKDASNKGHPRSMNMFLDLIKTPYVLNLEDDWEFFYPDNFITKMFNVIREDKMYGQVLINMNYAEDTTTYRNVRGSTLKYTKDNQRYFVHNFYTGKELEEQVKKLPYGNCYYWPHFSFRVGITRSDIYKEIGKFNEQAQHFEMDYAFKYFSRGYRTAFLDGVYSLHIGRRTYERETDMINAYDLNEEKQFGVEAKKISDVNKTLTTIVSESDKQKTLNENGVVQEVSGVNKSEEIRTSSHVEKIIPKKIEIRSFVINLKRRTDRLQLFYERNYDELPSVEVMEGFDGKYETPSHKIMKLFQTSDYDYRRGLVGAVVSHVRALKRFLKDHMCEYCVVCEDDIVLAKNFTSKLLYLIERYNGQFEVMFLHQNPYPSHNRMDFHLKTLVPSAYSLNGDEALKQNLGSAALYLITRKGAEGLLKHLCKNGAYNGFDWILMKTSGDEIDSNKKQRVMYSVPFLGEAPCFQLGQQDTDIQKEYGKIKWSDEEWDMNEFSYIYKILHSSVYNVNKNKTINLVVKIKEDASLIRRYVENNYTLTEHEGLNNVIYSRSILWNKIVDSVVIVPVQSVKEEDRKNLFRYAVKWYVTNKFLYIIPDKYVTNEVLEDRVFGNSYLNLVSPV
jgi:GR25 family glycosyltransferase involved in LPS biosynthesis